MAKESTIIEEVTPVAEVAPEPRNIAVEILENGMQIGEAICGTGPCTFPLTLPDATTLEALGKVRIIGIF